MRGDFVDAAAGHEHGIGDDGGIDGAQPHALLQNAAAEQRFEEHDGKAVVHERNVQAGPAYIAFPVQNGGAVQAAAAEYGLKNVAQAGNEKPERCTEPGQPARLGEEK